MRESTSIALRSIAGSPANWLTDGLSLEDQPFGVEDQ